MPKTLSVRGSQNLIAQLQSQESDALPLRAFFDSLAEALNCQLATIVTTLPRGSLQIVQPSKLDDSFLKSYARELHAFDRCAWEAIVRDTPVRGEDCFTGDNGFERSPFFTGLLQPHGLQHIAAVPLNGPVLTGFAGALELFRTPAQGAFSSAELGALNEIGKQFDLASARARQSRQGGSTSGKRSAPAGEIPARLRHRLENRLFVFDSHARSRVGGKAFDELDPSLRNAMLDLARQRLGHINGTPSASDRASLPDATGDLWHFRVVTHHAYPALGDGPFVFFCLSPECADWGALRANDFAADAELARLVPAIRFMQTEFHRGPTLNEIAKQVHLSPFHFHRRFTELFGITPKHLLLDCQIEQAKSMLIARQRELSEIATACGFAHQSHFTSRFKQATGLTPTRWRRLAMEAARK